MNHKKKIRKVLPFFSLFLLAGLMSFVISPVWGWEMQDKELAKDWEKMLGYKAPDLVGKIAPDIKVGMVIDSTNYKQYPGLQELLPKCLYDRFDPKMLRPARSNKDRQNRPARHLPRIYGKIHTK